jgi:hypothetical protein
MFAFGLNAEMELLLQFSYDLIGVDLKEDCEL